ncbi:MAG: hypothetical protein HY565_05535 [Candidatus Kerfeldbacteria bacterium]|nr:hypothetical protein [Candidatus Kerfeldbacteria bacterium]
MALNRISLSALFGLAVALLVFIPTTSADVVDDPYITSASLASSSTTLSATGVTYTVGFALSEAIPADYSISIDIMSSTGCGEDWEVCQVDLSGASVSGVSGVSATIDTRNINLVTTTALAAGSYTLTISNATNPANAAAVRAYVSTGASDEATLLGDAYSSEHWYTTPSNEAINIGTPLISGVVTAGGDIVDEIWVEMYSSDWSVSQGASTDSEGYYAIFADYDGAGQWASGAYSAAAYAQDGSGYITTTVDFAYSGSAVTQNIAFQEANTFFSGSVTYSDEDSSTVSVQAGTAVTDANVCFYSGTGSYCDATDSAGDYSVAVPVGSYSSYLSAVEDVSVDWRYEGGDDQYQIEEEGVTETVNFEVDPTTAMLTGSVSVPDGSEDIGGSVNLSNEEENYWGSVSDGSYSVNLNPGTYTLMFSPDTWTNDDWARYSYTDTVTIATGENELDFTVEELTSTIQFTVVSTSGEALEDVNVNAWTEGHWSGDQTDATGSGTVYVQSDTWYDVGVWHDTYLAAEPNQRVQVAANESAAVSFTMQLPNATIAATILDSDGNVAESLNGWFDCNTADYSSHFGTDLDNGTIELGVIVDEDTGEFDGQCSAWFPDEETGAVTPQDVTVAEGETATLEFTLLPLDATIKAIVKNFATGKKIEADQSINVNLWNEADDMGHWTRLDENPVEIAVVSDKSYSGGIWSENQRYIPLWSMNSESINVKSGETETMVLNVLEQDGSLHVTAKDSNGDPIQHGWAWCGNWEEVDFALDTVSTNTVINSGSEIRNGQADISLVAGHSYRCGVGAGEDAVEAGQISPPEQAVEFTSKNTPLDGLNFKFTEADATLVGSIDQSADFDSAWCWAWSEGGSSWTEVDPGEEFRLNLSTENGDWEAGCDGVADDNWYFTEKPYEFTPDKGKNSHDFSLTKMSAWKVYEAVSETFDVTENKVITYGDGTRLTIPAGTLATEGNVTVRGTPETNIVRTDDHPLTIPIDWEALDSDGNLIETFPGGNVTIEIPYTDEALTEWGIEEDSLVGKYWDDLSGTWKQPDNVSIDKDSNVITITTDHFTQYGATYNARVSSTRKPKMPSVTVKSTGKHNVKLALRTKKISPKSTRFVVQVRKVGASKAKWDTTKLTNAKKKARLVRSIQKLKRNTNYEVRSKACNSAGCSQTSAWESFKTE